MGENIYIVGRQGKAGYIQLSQKAERNLWMPGSNLLLIFSPGAQSWDGIAHR